MRSAREAGFSLIEIMVAIAILGLALTVILAAQGGLAASNRSASNMGQAVALGRCKMTELEEGLLKLGYQEIDQIETSVLCCVDGTPEAFTCDTRVEKIELPSMTASGDGGASLLTGAGALGPQNIAGGPGLNLNVMDGGAAALTSQLTAGQGAEGLLSMVMSFLYPSIKPMYEASVRKITVTVKWKEGPNVRELPITQYVTNPARGGFAGSALMADGGAMDFAPATAPAGSGANVGSTRGGVSR